MSVRASLLVIALLAAPAFAQQQATRTTEGQARSYVASAFISGAAPVIMSDKVILSPALRQLLKLPAESDGQEAYKALMKVTGDKQLVVRRAARDEISISEAPAPPSEQPIFAVE